MTAVENTTTESGPARPTGMQQHRRETRWQIYLPFVLGVLLVLLVAVVMALLPRRAQVSVIADFMLLIMILCPMVLCMFPLVLVTVSAAYGASRLHTVTGKPLERLEKLSGEMHERTNHLSETWGQRSITWLVRVEPVLRLMRIWDEPATSPEPPVAPQQDQNKTGEEATHDSTTKLAD